MLMAGKVVDRRLLLEGKGRRQPEAGRRRCRSLVADHQATAGIGQQPLDVGEQAAGEHEPVEGLLVAADEPRRVPGRQPQPLLLVEGGLWSDARCFNAATSAGGSPNRSMASIAPSSARTCLGGAGPSPPRAARGLLPGPASIGRSSSTRLSTICGARRGSELRNAHWSGHGSSVVGFRNTVVPRCRQAP
jgi:hypothetical protein